MALQVRRRFFFLLSEAMETLSARIQQPGKRDPWQCKKVKVTLKKTSSEIWVETEPLPVLWTTSHIVFDVARVDRHDSVVPYLIYDKTVRHRNRRF